MHITIAYLFLQRKLASHNYDFEMILEIFIQSALINSQLYLSRKHLYSSQITETLQQRAGKQYEIKQNAYTESPTRSTTCHELPRHEVLSTQRPYSSDH